MDKQIQKRKIMLKTRKFKQMIGEADHVL